MLHFRDLTVAPPLVLAPMAGITDRDFRLLIRRLGGCGLVCMEFISCEGLLRRRPSTLKMTHFAADERPLSIQIYGSDPLRMAEAARLVQDMGADVCDINMGCPANKVLKGCAGAALGGDLPLARRIVAAVRRAVDISLTVKFRLGLDIDNLTYLDLGRQCQEEGVDTVTLHPRTARQQYGGRADWSRIAELKATLSIPVIGNGDVQVAEDAVRMFQDTACDGVMIGRAAVKNPWIFRQTCDLLEGRQPAEPSLADRFHAMCRHFREVMAREDARTALHKLRTFTGWYTYGIPDGRHLRRRLSECRDAQAVMDAITTFFAERDVA